jgi:xylulokinase
MAVLLNAASAVDWAAAVTGFASPAAAYAAAEAVGTSGGVQFLPYLTGERTPHDDPHARGAFFGLGIDTTAAMLVHAAMEGVAFAFVDGRDALARAGGKCQQATVIGGGARSTYWGRILAAALDLPLTYCAGGETGPAYGAARLARLAVTGEDAALVCTRGPAITVIEPEPALRSHYAQRLARWRELYRRTRALMPHGADT